MKSSTKLVAFLFALCSVAGAQVVPAAMAGGAKFTYSARYAQAVNTYSDGLSDSVYAAFSGDAQYTNGGVRFPFVMNFGGGYDWNMAGTNFEPGLFENLFLSQGVVGHKWSLHLGDDVSYLPQAPTTGFTGIPGIGEPIGTPNPSPTTNQTILTLDTHVIENNALADFSYDLGHATVLSFGGSSGLLRYPDTNGLNSNTESANATLAQRLSSRNTLSGQYMFAQYSYPDYGVTFDTETGLIGFQRRWTRQLSTAGSIGPESITSSISSLVPSTRTIAGNASIAYQLDLTSFGLTYTRGIGGGGGYLVGAVVDSLYGNFSRAFGDSLTIGMTGGYLRNDALNTNGSTTAKFGGAQATWRLSSKVIVFANYTGTQQATTSTLPSNTLNQLLQTIGFGIGYASREPHFRQ